MLDAALRFCGVMSVTIACAFFLNDFEVITCLGLGMRWRAEISILVFRTLDVFAKRFKLNGLAAQILRFFRRQNGSYRYKRSVPQKFRHLIEKDTLYRQLGGQLVRDDERSSQSMLGNRAAVCSRRDHARQ